MAAFCSSMKSVKWILCSKANCLRCWKISGFILNRLTTIPMTLKCLLTCASSLRTAHRRTLFSNGATTRDAEDIAPAIRSRCAEIYFEPLTPQHIQTIVINAASKLKVTLEEGVAELISEYTIEGRKAVNILADAHGVSFVPARRGKDAFPWRMCTGWPR